MKRFILFDTLPFLTLLFTGQMAVAQYCVPNVGNCDYDIITNVTFVNINNSSRCDTYTDYTGDISTPVYQGESHLLSVTIEVDPGGAYIYAFIDWNQDGNWDNPSVYTLAENKGSGTYSTNIEVPAGAELGNTRMRVLLGILAETPDPCEIPASYAGSNWGEVEDYALNVQVLPGCVPPTGVTFSGITTTSADLTWSGDGDFEIKWGAPGFDPDDDEGESDRVSGETSYTISGLTKNQPYEAYVRQDCGEERSDWVGPVSFTPSHAVTYNDGDIPTMFAFPFDADTFCEPEATMTIVVPEGYRIAGLQVQYRMTATTADGGAYISEQQSMIYSPTLNAGEPSVAVADGDMPGTHLYNRTVSFANGATGTVDFVLRAWRTWSSTLYGCSAINQYVVNGTWVLIPTFEEIPSCLEPTGLAVTNMTANSADLSWNAVDGAEGYTWYVFAADADPETDEPFDSGSTAETNTVVVGLDHSTAYQAYVRSDCAGDGESFLAGPVAFNAGIIDCGGKFYDPGGPEGQYGNNQNITWTYFPENEGDLVSVTFTTFATQDDWDGLMIYDGPDTSAPLISSEFPSGLSLPEGTWTGSTFKTFSPEGMTFTSTHYATGALTFVFISDNGNTDAGWEADIACVPMPSCLAPTGLAVTNMTANSADLSWNAVDGAEGYTWYVFAAGADPETDEPFDSGSTSQTNKVVWLDQSTAYQAYVRSDCAEDGESLLVGPVAFNSGIIDCGGNFYDPGGTEDEYGNNQNITWTYFPENEGDLVSVTFTAFATELNWDGLMIYDGPDTSAPLISSGLPSGSSLPEGTWTGTTTFSPEGMTFTSTHYATGALTFVFTSDNSFTDVGWEADIACVSPPIVPDAGGIVYVKETPTGTQDGSSWTNATNDLQRSINAGGVRQVWVAGGTYKPRYRADDMSDADPNDRDDAFVLKEGVKLYGGFAGTETDLTQRDLTQTANASVLSGDLGTIDDSSDNAYHVVISTDCTDASVLDGFTIRDGNANSSGHIVVNGVVVNKGNGGGMYNDGSAVLIRNCSFTSNTATDAGGTGNGAGVYNGASSPVITGCTFSGNISDNQGGAIYNEAASFPVITHCTFNNNESGDGGGGIFNISSSPIISNCSFSGNTSDGSGGAICNAYGVSPMITGSTFTGNTAGVGGAIVNAQVTHASYISNCVFSGNTADKGGAMHNAYSSPLLGISNCTFVGNVATTSGGAMENQDASPTVTNCIIYDNSSSIDHEGDDSSAPVVTYSNVQQASGAYPGAGNTNADPLFVNADNPAGADGIWGTADDGFMVQAGSLAINAGTSDTTGLQLPTTDLAGNARVQNGRIDMGAYESPYSPITPDANGIAYVDKNVVGGIGSGDSWENALTELADALKAAKTNTDIQEIWVAKSTYRPLYSPEDGANFGTDQGRDNAFLLVADVKIYGGFAGTESTLSERDLTQTANASILSGDLGIPGDSTDNAYHVVVGSNAAILDGFTIRDGNANESGSITVNTRVIARNQGGGVNNTYSSPTLENLNITYNAATQGGGMYNYWGNPRLSVVTFSNNTADEGGAIHSYRTAMQANRVLITGNAAATNGGGVYNDFLSTPRFTNVVISKNTAAAGGAMYNRSSDPILTNVTIADNTAAQGAAVYSTDYSISQIRNSVIHNHTNGFYYGIGATYIISHSLAPGNSSASGGANGNLSADADPLFEDAANNDYRLRKGSMLINRGNSAWYAPGSEFADYTTDFAGNARIQQGAVDIGAFESEFLPALGPDGNQIVYVRPVGAGNQTGDSWVNATTDLQQAIDANGVQQVWVAGGTYKPRYRADDLSDADASDRDNAFVLKAGVELYGSLTGTETDLAQRDSTVMADNPSVLSGDLGAIGATGDNAYHVVISAEDGAAAALNGFTVSDGHANGSEQITVNGKSISQANGGGLYLASSSPQLTALKVQNNTASSGGGLYVESATPLITSVLINSNTASTHGGGMYSESSLPYLTNVTIAGNTAAQGGGLYNSSSNTEIRNSIIHGNSDGVVNMSSVPVISYSLVQGLSGTDNGNVDGGTDPGFADAANGNYRLQALSPVLNIGNNEYYAGGSAPDLSAHAVDIEGKQRIKEIIELGAYESYFPRPLTPDANGILYVTTTGAGTQLGDSWANASTDLQRSIRTPGVQQVWVAGGTYLPKYRADNMSDAGPEDGANAFLLKEGVKVYGSFAGTESSLAQRDSTVMADNPSILDGDLNGDYTTIGNASHIVISVGCTPATVLDGFTITRGVASAGQSITVEGYTIHLEHGGGMYNASSSPTLANLRFDSNFGEKGGGMYNEDSSPVLTHVQLFSNIGRSYGGGGMYNKNSSPILTHVSIAGNQGLNGAGMYNESSSPVLTHVRIAVNEGTHYGAGMYNESSSPVLTNVLFVSNRSGWAGGMCNVASSAPVLTNVTIYNSTVGVHVNSDLIIPGSAIHNDASSPQIRNSIIYGSTDPVVLNVAGSAPVITHSLVQGLSDTDNGNIAGDTDPLFLLSSSSDLRLQPLSPAINKGSNAYFEAGSIPDLSAITTDFAGNPRIQDGTVDMGALESPVFPVLAPDANGIIYVSTAGAGNRTGDSWANAADDLQLSINAAGVQQVWVKGGTYLPIRKAGEQDTVTYGNRDNAFVLKEGIKVYGGFAGNETTLAQRDGAVMSANPSVLSGVLGGATGTYHVVVSAGCTEATVLDGFTISGGQGGGSGTITVNSKAISRQYGGGITNVDSSPLLSNLYISGNTTGGGMYNESSSPILTNVLIIGNSAHSISGVGGGMYNASSSPVLTNVTIAANTAFSASAMYNSASSPRIRNSVIYGNKDGIVNDSSVPVITYSLVQGLSATDNGNIDGNTNPLFVDLRSPAANAGGNYRLQPTSPLINKGNNAYFEADKTPDLSAIVTDLDGNDRIQQGTVDMGAYEYLELVDPVLSGFTDMTKTYGDADFALTAPNSNSSGTFSYTSDNEDVAVVAGNTVTIVGAGTATITATQAARANYNAGSISLTLTVNKADPALSGFADITKTYGDADFALAAPTSDSDGAFSYTSDNEDVATITGSTVTIVGIGTATVMATQAETANYNEGSIDLTLTVVKADPTLSGFVDITKTYDDADFVLTAPISDSDGAFTYGSSDENVATITGNTVTIIGAGTATITATQAETANYNEGSIDLTLTVVKADPTLSGFADISKTYGDAEFDLAAPTSDSDGTFSYISDNEDVAVVTGNTVTIVGVGMATVTVTQAATANYNAGSISLTLTVDKADPALSGFADITKTYGDADFVLIAPAGNSDGIFTYISSDENVATITGSTVIIVGVGMATITATQAEAANHREGSISLTLTVGKADITGITFANGVFTYDGTEHALAIAGTLPAGATVSYVGNGRVEMGSQLVTATIYGGTNYHDLQLTATLAVVEAAFEGIGFAGGTFTYDGTAKSIAVTGLPEGATVGYANNSQTEAGTYTVLATVRMAGHADLELSATLTIEKAAITGIMFDNGVFTYDGTEHSLSITGSLPAGTSVDYVNNSRPDVGSQTVTATITGGNNYHDLALTASLTVVEAAFGGIGFANSTFTYDGTAKSLSVAGIPLGATVSYTIGGAPGNSAMDAGTYTVVATVSMARYTDLELQATLTIEKATITGITFGNGTFVYDGTPKSLAFSGELPTGTTVSYVGNGRTDMGSQLVTATIMGGTNYHDLVLTATLSVVDAAFEGIGFANATFTYDGTSKSLSVTSLPVGAMVRYANNGQIEAGTYAVLATVRMAGYADLELSATLTIEKAPITGITFDNGTFVYDGTAKSLAITGTLPAGTSVGYAGNGRVEAGNQPVTATVTGGTNYHDLVLMATLRVTPATRMLSFPALPEKTYGDGDFDAGAEASGGEAVLYTSDNESVAQVVAGLIRIVGAGTATITATVLANGNYSSRPQASQALTVHRASQTIKLTAPSEVGRDIGMLPLGVSATSGLPVALSVDDEQVATLNGLTLLIHRLGTVHITATQEGDTNHEAAEAVTIVTRVVDPSATFPVRVHPAVSPNSDGINEFLMIEGIRDYPDNRVRIFNRNGTVVYEVSAYDNGERAFRGIGAGGVRLPPGTYFYVAEVRANGQLEHHKGYLVLRY